MLGHSHILKYARHNQVKKIPQKCLKTFSTMWRLFTAGHHTPGPPGLRVPGCYVMTPLLPTDKHGERRPPLPHLVPRPQSLRHPGRGRGALRFLCTMNMLKSTGLKIPGRGPKHSSPVGRASAGGTSSPVIPKDSKSLPPDPPPLSPPSSYFFSSPEVAQTIY